MNSCGQTFFLHWCFAKLKKLYLKHRLKNQNILRQVGFSLTCREAAVADERTSEEAGSRKSQNHQ